MAAAKSFMALTFPCVTLLGCAHCVTCDYSPASERSAAPVAATTPASDSHARERSTVRQNRDGSTTYIFSKPGETTVVGRDGVTVIQRDRDGTRTVVRPDGNVRVTPPHSGGKRR